MNYTRMIHCCSTQTKCVVYYSGGDVTDKKLKYLDWTQEGKVAEIVASTDRIVDCIVATGVLKRSGLFL